MKRSAILAYVFLIISATSLSAQSKTQTVPPQSAVSIPLSKNEKPPVFINGRTVVTQVVLQGLDTDDETYGFRSEDGIYKSHFLRDIRGEKTWVVEGQKFDIDKVSGSLKALKTWLAEQGYLNAEVIAYGAKLDKTTMKLTFFVDRGIPLDPPELKFVGNERVQNQEFVDDFKSCSGDLWKRYIFRTFQYLSQHCTRQFLFSKGFFEAKVFDIRPKLVGNNYRVTFGIYEGPRYIWGAIKIRGAKEFSEKELMEMFGQNTGDVADGRYLKDFVYERLRREYAERGYIQYNAEFDPDLVQPKEFGFDGTANVTISIDDGMRFSVDRIEFIGVEKDVAEDLRNNFLLKKGDVFVQSKFESSIAELNKSEKFCKIYKDSSEVEILADEVNGKLDLNIKLKKCSSRPQLDL